MDDSFLFSNNLELTSKAKVALSSKYKMTDLEDLYSSFNLQIITNMDNKMLFLNQSKYIQEKLEKFNLNHAKCMATPLEPKSNLEKLNEIIQEEE